MTTYTDRIPAELVANGHHNRTDPHALAVVEHIMRDGLDWLTLNGFEYAARYALAHAEGLAADGQLPEPGEPGHCHAAYLIELANGDPDA